MMKLSLQIFRMCTCTLQIEIRCLGARVLTKSTISECVGIPDWSTLSAMAPVLPHMSWH